MVLHTLTQLELPAVVFHRPRAGQSRRQLERCASYAASGSKRWRSTSTVALAAAAVPGSTDVVSSMTANVHCAGPGDCAASATDHEVSSASPTPKASILVRTPKFNFIVAPSALLDIRKSSAS